MPLVIGFAARRATQALPAVADGEAGAIVPDKLSAWVTVTGGAALGLIGALVVAEDDPLAGAFVVLLGGAIAGFMLPSVTGLHVVRWSAHGIEGPSRRFGPTLGAQRTEIAWSDITAAGRARSGYWFVEAADGRRVYWSSFHRGHGALAAALRRRRPELALPAGLA